MMGILLFKFKGGPDLPLVSSTNLNKTSLELAATMGVYGTRRKVRAHQQALERLTFADLRQLITIVHT